MDDDLNISEALAGIFDFIREVNKLELSAQDAKAVTNLLDKFDTVLGILQPEELEVSAEIKALIQERESARQQRDYQKSDAIRAKLMERGIILEDTPAGVRWKKVL